MILASYNLAIKKHKKDFFEAVDMLRINSPWYTMDDLDNVFKYTSKPKFVDVNIKQRSKAKITDHNHTQLLSFVGKNNVDWVGISNVEDPEVYSVVRKLLGNQTTKICAKIETDLGCWKAEDIMNEFDGIMVDVEDLASEVGWEKASEEKNRIYKLCEEKGKDYFRLAGVIFEYVEKNREKDM